METLVTVQKFKADTSDQHRNLKHDAWAAWPDGVYKHQTQLGEQGWVCGCAVWV